MFFPCLTRLAACVLPRLSGRAMLIGCLRSGAWGRLAEKWRCVERPVAVQRTPPSATMLPSGLLCLLLALLLAVAADRPEVAAVARRRRGKPSTARAARPVPPAPEAAIAAGRLRGKWSTTRSGRPIAAFEGVPFAKPPVGALRFQVGVSSVSCPRCDLYRTASIRSWWMDRRPQILWTPPLLIPSH